MGRHVILAMKIVKKLENYPNRHKFPVPTRFLQDQLKFKNYHDEFREILLLFFKLNKRKTY